MELLAAGREADVYLVDDNTVLRRCRDERTRCESVAALMEWVRDAGYPVPHVHSVDGPDMVLDRVSGPTMLESLVGGSMNPAEGGQLLAELSEHLHTLPPPPGSGPAAAVRHLDLHPGNVMLTGSGPVVIDWSNTDVGSPGVDTALSAVIVYQAMLAPIDLVPPHLLSGVSELLEVFLRRSGPLAPADVRAAVTYRSGDPMLSSGELDVLDKVLAVLLGHS